MSFSTQHIADLLFRSLEGNLEEKDRRMLQEWLDASAHHRDLYTDLHSEERLREQLLAFRPEEQAAVNQRILNQVNAELFVTPAVHRVHFLKTAWFKYAAAIIIIFGTGAYLWNKQNDSRTITQTQPVPIEKDILPGGQKAMLTLADGRTIVLDSAVNGQLAIENGSEVIKKDGQVIYGAGQLNNIDVTFNTMSTPKGGQYQLTLADGTKVWLNAASSITYPTVFKGKTREVNITGEVYFEVKKNASKAFVVKTSKEEITVLGTHFNVNTYPDEPSSKISLLEGSIKVNEIILTPGYAFTNGKVVATNTSQDVAWKNGFFAFADADIKTVMRQLARWYDVDIQYDGKIPGGEFTGDVGRNLSLSKLLRALSTYGFHYRIENKKIIISD